MLTKTEVTLSTRAVKYADCTSAVDKTLIHNNYPGYGTKLHLMVKLQSWNFRKYGIEELQLVPGLLWPGTVIPVPVPIKCQIELDNHLQKIIIISYLKPYSCVQIVCVG